MEPYNEQRLRDEVIYLHSLWHQGPPSTTPISRPKRKLPQQPPNPTNKLLKPDPPSNSDTQWPQSNSVAGPSTRSETAEEKGGSLALELQHNASNVFKELLAKSGSDSDYEGGSEEEVDYWVGNGEDKYLIFLRIFMEDYELRKYYQENSEGGEFCCLVCYGLGKKNSGRRFKSCLCVAQHSIAVSNSDDESHRALAQAICRVLGWDFDKLPVVVLKGQPLGSVLIKKGETHQGNVGNEGTHKDLGNTDKGAFGELVSNQAVVSTSEWPCEDPVDNPSSTALEWRAFEPSLPSTQLASAANSVSAEDQARLTVMRSQHVAVKACQNYFQRKKGSDCSECDDESGEEDTTEDSDNEEDVSENSEDEEEDNSDEEENASKTSKLFTFFFDLFKEEDSKLKDFYLNNWEAGEFCCLVCGGIGKKVWKRYKGCVALVQHSTAISKTKKKLAHRAYSRAVCQVLGWDIKRLPSNALGQPSQNSSHMPVELEENHEGITSDKDSSVHQNGESAKGNELPSSSSQVQSPVKSDELQQGDSEGKLESL